MLKTIMGLDQQKSIDYFFRGKITEKRFWMLGYEGGKVSESNYGRDPSLKSILISSIISICRKQNLRLLQPGTALGHTAFLRPLHAVLFPY